MNATIFRMTVLYAIIPFTPQEVKLSFPIEQDFSQMK